MMLALVRARRLAATACSLARSRQGAVDTDVRRGGWRGSVFGRARGVLRSTSCPTMRTNVVGRPGGRWGQAGGGGVRVSPASDVDVDGLASAPAGCSRSWRHGYTPGRRRARVHAGLDGRCGLDAAAERRSLVDVADASGVYVGDGTNSGLVPVVCPVGLSHRDGARAASTASRRRNSPTDVDARPRTVSIQIPVVSGVRRSAQAEEVVPATCPIG